MRNGYVFLLLLLTAGLWVGCEKTADPDGDPDYDTARDHAQAQATYDDLYSLGETAMNEAGVNKVQTLCATLDLDTTARVLTIDFGSGCTGDDGRTRSGIIRVAYLGRRFLPGFTATYTFQNYRVDGIGVSGTLVSQGFTFNNSGQLTFSYEVIGGQLSYPDGTTLRYSGNRTLTLTAGSFLTNLAGIRYEVSGSGNGISRLGVAFTEEIVEPLEVRYACLLQGSLFPVSGRTEYQLTASGQQFEVTFGNGSCDNEAVLLWNGNTFNFTLR